ncbi:MAG: hypothetical protein ABI343_21125 [Burkholderiaceae bacterium]
MLKTFTGVGIDALSSTPAEYSKPILGESERLKSAIIAAHIQSQ